MKHLIVTFSDKSKWAIPADIVASHYANRRTQQGMTFEDAYHQIVECEEQLEIWAKTEMIWKEMQPFARQLAVKPVEYSSEWHTVEIEFKEGEELL